MRRLFFALLVIMLAASNSAQSAQTDDGGTRFVAIAFHDVVDDRRDLGDDAMTTGTLIEFFEWLKANGWTAISANDVLRAARGEQPLPPRAILITFDDGYRSLYTRVFPLLLAYRIPIVSALVGTWMDAPMDATVNYDGRIVPRRNFLSWAEAREMQASGLVEFGSHSYDLHRGVTGNPQGNLMPGAVTREFRAGAGYESDATHRARLEADARRISDLLNRELGRKPRVWIWPYGRYSETGIDAVRKSGFEMALTLDAGPGDTGQLMSVPRQYPGADAAISTLTAMVRLQDKLPTARRLLCLDPGELWTGSHESSDERLGKAIERLRILGSTAVVIDAFGRDAAGRISHAWFPTDVLPVKADLLSRITWQLQTRAGMEVLVRLPANQALAQSGSLENTLALFRDLGASVPLSGVFVDDAPGLAQLTAAHAPSAGQPWETRAARDRLAPDTLQSPERTAILAFRAVQRSRPWASLTVASAAPALHNSIADLTLRSVGFPADGRLSLTGNDGEPGGHTSRRTGLWLTGKAPPEAGMLGKIARQYQQRGGTALGWCPDSPVSDRPVAREVEPDVSTATFPVRF